MAPLPLFQAKWRIRAAAGQHGDGGQGRHAGEICVIQDVFDSPFSTATRAFHNLTVRDQHGLLLITSRCFTPII